MKRHQRPKKTEWDAIAYALDPWKGSGEVVHVGARSKKNPLDLRYIMNFGIEHRALQWLVLLVLREMVELHPNQYGTRGTHLAIEHVKKAMSDGYLWAIEFDIKNFYPSFNGKELSNFLPLPKKVIEAVLLGEHLNVKGGSSLCNLFGCEKDDDWGPLIHLLVEARWGIPPGSAASPLIADAVLSSTLYLIPKIGLTVAYADNILLLAKTKADVVSMAQCLGSALKAHPAGPFQPKLKHFDAGHPIEFLGHKLTAKNGVVCIEPDDHNLESIKCRVKSELAYLGKTSPSVTWKTRLNRLEADIRGWAAAFKLWENAEALKAQLLGQVQALGK